MGSRQPLIFSLLRLLYRRYSQRHNRQATRKQTMTRVRPRSVHFPSLNRIQKRCCVPGRDLASLTLPFPLFQSSSTALPGILKIHFSCSSRYLGCERSLGNAHKAPRRLCRALVAGRGQDLRVVGVAFPCLPTSLRGSMGHTPAFPRPEFLGIFVP